MSDIKQRVAQALREAGFNEDPVDPIENQAADILAAYDADGLVVVDMNTDLYSQAAAERDAMRPVVDAAVAWREAELHHRSLDAETDDVAWNDTMVTTVKALNALRDAVATYLKEQDDD